MLLIVIALIVIGGLAAAATYFTRLPAKPAEEVAPEPPPWPAHETVGQSVEGRTIDAYTYGSGDTHQLNHLAALLLQILVDGPRSEHELLTELGPHSSPEEAADLPQAVERTLRELQRIGLVRHSTP